MRTLIALMTATALVALAAPVTAHGLEVAGHYVTPHPDHAADDPLHYAEHAAVFKETNGVAGLQKCAYEDDSGRLIEADEHVAGAEPHCG